MTSALETAPVMSNDKYLNSIHDSFAHLACGKIDVEYVGSALDTVDDECMVMLHEMFENYWSLHQILFPGHIPDNYPVETFRPDQHLHYSEAAKEIEEAIKSYFEKLQKAAEERGIMQFTLNVIARVRFSSSVYQQKHIKETRTALFEVTWNSRSGSTECYSEILEAYEKMLERYMEVECLPENVEHLTHSDRNLRKECERRAALRQIAAE